MELAPYCALVGTGGEVGGDPTRRRDEVKRSDKYGKTKTAIWQRIARSSVSMSISKGQVPYRDDPEVEGLPESSRLRDAFQCGGGR